LLKFAEALGAGFGLAAREGPNRDVAQTRARVGRNRWGALRFALLPAAHYNSESMSAYLLTWSKWPWDDLPDAVATTAAGHRYPVDWTVHAHRAIQPEDRVFLVRLGQEVRRKRARPGIIASGWVKLPARGLPHWDTQLRAAGQTIYKAGVEFDTVLQLEDVLPEDRLPYSRSRPTFSWTPENSGVGIRDDAAAKLERVWAEWVQTRRQPARRHPIGRPPR
jgi:hypothetical protein